MTDYCLIAICEHLKLNGPLLSFIIKYDNACNILIYIDKPARL